MRADTAPQWRADLRAARGAPAAPARTAPDAVNLPMIRRWCEAMGERNPLYLDETYAATSEYGGVVAPPAMLEVWTMGRFRADGSTDTGQLLGMDLLNAAGFTAVVATNLEQDYLRYLRPGDLITQRVFLEDISDEKRTALGAGHFLDYRYEFSDQKGELVGRMRFRILKFRPTEPVAAARAPSSKPAPPRPSVTRDSAFFWEGLQQRTLLIRRCSRCGHLHHPPGPMCPRCHSLEWTPQSVSGRGVIHSYVIVHQPQLPGFSYPLPVALVELEEGVRLIGNLYGFSPDSVRIGTPVEVQFDEVEPGYLLYAFRERAG
jgi:uncharacterized OB-fold protein/acyl dehydratase